MKRTILIFLILVISFAFMGCEKTEEGKTVVHLWHQMEPEKRPLLKQVIADFEQNNPDIEIVVLAKGTEELRTGYQAAAAFTGGGPELVYGPMDQIGSFEVMKEKNSDESIIKPIEDLYPPEFFDKFVDQGLVTYKGHIYQIADRLGNHLALVYNKRLFEEAGLTEAPQTIDELIEFGKKLTIDKNGDGTIDQWGFVWNYTEPFWYIPFFGGYGGKVFDENNNPELDTPAAEEAFQLILDMRNKSKIMPPECDYDIADNMFNQGNAAMIINGDWSWNKYIASPHVDFGLARIPYVEKTHMWCSPMVSATGYSVNGSAKGEVLEATKRVLDYLTSEEVQEQFVEKFKSIPSLKSLQERPAIANDPIMMMSAKQIEAGQLMPIIPEMRAAWEDRKSVV